MFQSYLFTMSTPETTNSFLLPIPSAPIKTKRRFTPIKESDMTKPITSREQLREAYHKTCNKARENKLMVFRLAKDMGWLASTLHKRGIIEDDVIHEYVQETINQPNPPLGNILNVFHVIGSCVLDYVDLTEKVGPEEVDLEETESQDESICPWDRNIMDDILDFDDDYLSSDSESYESSVVSNDTVPI